MANKLSVRLKYDGMELDLNGSAYKVATDFVPPSTSYDLLLTSGTSANRYNGSTLYDRKAENRTWQFGVKILGDSAGENRILIGRLRAMLNNAYNDKPLFLEFKAGADIPDPTYGQQGAPLRYEIVDATLTTTDLFGDANIRDTQNYPDNIITLQVKPYALGVETALGKAEGTLYYYPIGDRPALGSSRATTNLFTNPIFGNSTPTTGWTTPTGGAISYDIALWGGDNNKVAYKIYTGNLTQSLTLPIQTHTISCYARKPDGSAVTSSDAQIFYNGSTLTTRYEPVGEGWYRLRGTTTGTGGAADTGVQATGTVIVDGFQAEQATYARNFVHGDMVGASWSSTAHNSSSSSTATVVRFPSGAVRRDAGTVRVAVRFPYDFDEQPGGSYRIFDVGAFELQYDATAQQFQFTDGTNTATSAVASFSGGDILIFHCVYSDSGLTMYIDGTADGTAGAYSIGAFNADIYIGSNTAGNVQIDAWILDFAVFDEAFDATQVTADYADLSVTVQDGDALSSIPVIWTNDGDNILDNCLDVSAGDYNYAWITGVPGDVPAITRLLIDVSGAGSTDLYMSNLDCDDHFNPDGFTFVDESGTVDASRCGGEYQATTTTNKLGDGLTAISAGNRALAQYAGKTVYGISAMYMPATLDFYTRAASIDSENGEFSDGAAFDLLTAGGIVMPPITVLNRPEDEYTFAPLVTSESPGGSVTYNVDFHAYFCEPVLRIVNLAARVTTSTDEPIASEMSSNTITARVETQGNNIEFVPHRWNLLQVFTRDNATRLHDITDTTTLTEVTVTPRYEVTL